MIKSFVTGHPPAWSGGDVIKGLFLCTRGRSQAELESALQDLYAVKSVAVFNLGRNALAAALSASGIEKGCNVIIPDIVCETVIRSVLRAGFRPVLADVEDNLHLSARTVADCLGMDAKAVIVAHLYGMAAPVADIRNATMKSGLFLVDDAAQAVGIQQDGRYLGTFGDCGILSFGPFKSLALTRGGALLTNSREFVDKTETFRRSQETSMSGLRRVAGGAVKFHGRPYYLAYKASRRQANALRATQVNREVTVKAHETTENLSRFEASLVKCNLQKIPMIIKARQADGCEIIQFVKSLNHVELVGGAAATCFKLPMKVNGRMNAGQAVDFLRGSGVEAERIYRPLHMVDAYKCYLTNHPTNSCKLYEEVFLVPNPSGRGKRSIERLKQMLGRLDVEVSRKQIDAI